MVKDTSVLTVFGFCCAVLVSQGLGGWQELRLQDPERCAEDHLGDSASVQEQAKLLHGCEG
jgi:hypothetical protein